MQVSKMAGKNQAGVKNGRDQSGRCQGWQGSIKAGVKQAWINKAGSRMAGINQVLINISV
jgi:hypothetical protein